MRTWVKIAIWIVLGVGLLFLYFSHQNKKAKELSLIELILLAFLISFSAGSIRDFLREQDYGGGLPILSSKN